MSLLRSVMLGDDASKFIESDGESEVSVGLGERPGGELGGDMSARAMQLDSRGPIIDEGCSSLEIFQQSSLQEIKLVCQG